MKKVLISLIVIMSVLLIGYGFSYAISGQCVNCHTMHASQNGTFPSGMTSGPNSYLLLAGCITCHEQNGGGQGDVNSFPAPIVFHTTAPSGQGGTYTNAGGDFYWVATGYGATDGRGHNVAGISGEDAVIGSNAPGYTPPGWDPGATPGALADGQIAAGAADWGSNQLNCAGQFGCHGNHSAVGDFPGIHGAHHGNTGGTATQASSPTTIGNSYRFLSGIKGLEQVDWNFNETTASHNEYYGYNDPNIRIQSYTTYNDKGTISYMCAECHGKFHSQIDEGTLGTPWLRHPTDIVLGRGAGTEYSAYNPNVGGGGTTYSLQAPVARGTVPATSSLTVNTADGSGATGAIVMCLSCHRAHGSDQADILRWDYAGMVAGSSTNAGTGCFTCHTTKDG